MACTHTTKRLQREDLAAFRAMLGLFADVFEDRSTYIDRQPDDDYIRRLLSSEIFVAIAAFAGHMLVGGLAGYVLPKFEQARKEIYIYDLAVHAGHRRLGVATALIEALQRIACGRGAYVIFVQADLGDDAAVALYSKLGMREDVVHFDIAPSPPARA